MQRIGSIIKQINRRNKMETETFECAHKVAFPSRDGGGKYSIYVKKDNGDDMTIYGEAIGAEGWQKGARLKITAEPKRQSKTGKWYQTAKSVELLEGEVNVNPTVNIGNTYGGATTTPISTRDPDAQKKEKYRMTMSNLISSYMSGGKMPSNDEFNQIDKFVKQILDVQMNNKEEIKSDAPPF